MVSFSAGYPQVQRLDGTLPENVCGDLPKQTTMSTITCMKIASYDGCVCRAQFMRHYTNVEHIVLMDHWLSADFLLSQLGAHRRIPRLDIVFRQPCTRSTCLCNRGLTPLLRSWQVEILRVHMTPTDRPWPYAVLERGLRGLWIELVEYENKWLYPFTIVPVLQVRPSTLRHQVLQKLRARLPLCLVRIIWALLPRFRLLSSLTQGLHERGVLQQNHTALRADICVSHVSSGSRRAPKAPRYNDY